MSLRTRAPAATSPEALIEEARRLGRRRRRRVALIVLSVLVVALALAIAVLSGAGRPADPAGAAPQRHAPAVAPATSRPDVYVAHAPGQTALPGSITVYDTTTGAPVRVLGAEYDPYLQNGFALTADGTTLYYQRLNEPAQTFELVSVPVAGGPAVVVGHGGHPRFSPDGRFMAYLSHGPANRSGWIIRDLRTGRDRTIRPPDSDRTVQVAWLGDSRRLLVTATTQNEPPCHGPAGFSCPTEAPTPLIADAYLLDPGGGGTPTWTRLPALEGSAGWADLTLLQPVSGDDQLLTITRAPDAAAMHTVDLYTGTITATLPLPPGRSLLALDPTGSHLLLAGPAGTERWTPGADPVVIGPPAAQADW